MKAKAAESNSGRMSTVIPIGTMVLTYSAALAWVGHSSSFQHGFPLDDSYIHQTVARNLVRYGVLGFVPGTPSSGATSLFWSLIQASNYKLFHADPVSFNLVLSWGLLVSIGIFLFLLAKRDGLPITSSLAFATAPACSGNFIWLGLIGMEHLLFVLLLLGCIYLRFGKQNPVSSFWAGMCAGLLTVTRPEAIVFGPILAIREWKDNRSVKDLLILLAPWIVSVVILFATDLYTSHSLMPVTLDGRKWLYFHAIGGPHSLLAVLSFLLGWMPRVALQFSLWPRGTHLFLLRVIVPLALAFIGATWLIGNRSPRIRFLFLLAAVHSCVFLVEFPAIGHGWRYQPLNVLLLFPCIVFGVLYLLRRLTTHPHVPTVVAILVLVCCGAASLRTWHTVSIVGLAHINNTEGLAAQWILHNSPVNSTVATFDIGRISYDLDGRDHIIDLGGLVDHSYIAYLQSGRVPSYVRERHANYVIIPSELGYDLGFQGASEPPLLKLAEFCSPYDIWYIGWTYTGHAERCQIIYGIQ